MQTLIEQLERATGPDINIDKALADHFGTVKEFAWPSYTDSIDAALTLVPERCWLGRLEQDSNMDGRRTFGCQIMWATEASTREALSMYRPSAAIALCIAALKARELIGQD